MKKRNIYSGLGTYFQEDSLVKKINDESLFSTEYIDVNLLILDIPTVQNSNIYKVKSIECRDDSIASSIHDDLNKVIKRINHDIGNNTNIYKGDSWSIFYLFKELITDLEGLGYNFFRGQQRDWETKPAIFRNLENKSGEVYYEKFESLYEELCHEFPEEIEYHEYPTDQNDEKINTRADQLAILQHYGIPTSLLDITENPFIALLFMFGTGIEIDKPQFQAYKIDIGAHEQNSLVSMVNKYSKNKRIKAQKGAFLNYDKLEKFTDKSCGDLSIDSNYKKISRVVITLNIDIESSIRFLENDLKKTKTDILSVFTSGEKKDFKDIYLQINLLELARLSDKFDSKSPEEVFKEMIDSDMLISLNDKKKSQIGDNYRSDIENVIKALTDSPEANLSKVYTYIQEEILKKLKEFKYQERDLYPDFVDYIAYKRREFIDPTNKNEEKQQFANIDFQDDDNEPT